MVHVLGRGGSEEAEAGEEGAYVGGLIDCHLCHGDV